MSIETNFEQKWGLLQRYRIERNDSPDSIRNLLTPGTEALVDLIVKTLSELEGDFDIEIRLSMTRAGQHTTRIQRTELT